jgi:DNA-binding GntR family transcriptional regulator
MSTRHPVREELIANLRDRILRGEFLPGSRVHESTLATQLQVSRTPVREALFRLEQEGFVQADMDRGFLVKPLTAREVREVYPILWTLEGLALRNAGLTTMDHLAELQQINAALLSVQDQPEQRLTLDTRWHRVLLDTCPNQRLLQMIDSLKQVAYRYEWAYMRDTALVETSVQQHEVVMVALKEHNLERAVEQLEVHWHFGMDALLRRLDWL